MTLNNLELMRTLDDSWNAQDWATFEKRHSKDTTVFWPGQAEPTRGRDNHKAEPAPCGDDATAVAADPGSPNWAPRSWESHPSASASESAVHLGDRSSAFVLPACKMRHSTCGTDPEMMSALAPDTTKVSFEGFVLLPQGYIDQSNLEG